MCAQECCCKSLKLDHPNPHRTCQQNRSCVSYPNYRQDLHDLTLRSSQFVSSFSIAIEPGRWKGEFNFNCYVTKVLWSLCMVWMRCYRQASCLLQCINSKLHLPDLSPSRMLKNMLHTLFHGFYRTCLVRERLCFDTKPLTEEDNQICKTKGSEKSLRKKCQEKKKSHSTGTLFTTYILVHSFLICTIKPM